MKTLPVVAITGANGYVGSVIADALQNEARILGLVRSPKGPDQILWSFDTDSKGLTNELRDRRVTHLVHAAWDMKATSLWELERSCVRGSGALFAAAESAGVQGLTFISSISAFDGARSAYGRSKLEVEAMAFQAGGAVLRLGLVYGDRGGGMFGSLQQVVRISRFVPMIGDGKTPQYLLHERELGHVIRRAVQRDFAGDGNPITVAQPQPMRFRDVLLHIAAEEGRSVSLIPVPWRILYAALWSAECLGLQLRLRSDSILSFVYQNSAPDFSQMRRYGIDLSRSGTL
jgi:nucleoside-diphosphate-sugar epimerase